MVRSHAGPVQNRIDGKEIFQGNASSYWDRDIEPGVTYWYNVFLQRDGVLSSGAAEGCQEVVNLFEIGEVSVTPGDGSLRLSLCEENTEADVDAILKAVPEIVAYLRNMSPLWKDKVSGKKEFVL